VNAAKRLTHLPYWVNYLVVIVPFVGFLVALVLLWEKAVYWQDLAVLVFMYLITGIGLTVGFHRLLTHRSFETGPRLRYVLAVLGSMAVENPAIIFVADHRKHHRFADQAGDPHSPHVDVDGSGLGLWRGLWHAHLGWLLKGERHADPIRYAPDVLREPAMRVISRNFIPLALAGLLLPAVLGLLLHGVWWGALTGLLWGGLVRIFLFHHVSFAVNSIGHYSGRRRFKTKDRSTNVAWLALVSFGDSWHHNHHAFPTSAFHGLRRWEIDPGGMVIRVLERLGLATNVVRVSAGRMQREAMDEEGSAQSHRRLTAA
jgi:stearoyl-CoA desaturase (delta-9 desaturase)